MFTTTELAAFLTCAALDLTDGHDSSDLDAAFETLPQEGWEEVVETLSQILRSSGEGRQEYWESRVRPFWERICPKCLALASDHLAESLADLCVAAGDAFPVALAAVKDGLRVVERPYFVLRSLHESGLCARFPESALSFINAIVSAEARPSTELSLCFSDIASAVPEEIRA